MNLFKKEAFGRMSGHSQFHNIMYRKGAQDAKRAKTFAKIGREIFVAAKLGGQDPNANPRLRAALANARSVNMPNDNVNRVLKKASGNDSTESYEEVRYEGFGPGGTAFIVEGLTDNRNRTAPEIRAIFSKHGGNLGEVGSVSFMFNRVGKIIFSKETVSFETLFEQAVEAGAADVSEDDSVFAVSCSVENFSAVRDALTKNIGEPIKSEIVWEPINTVDCDLSAAKTIIKMIDALEDNDDVQNVYSNFSTSDEVEAQLESELS